MVWQRVCLFVRLESVASQRKCGIRWVRDEIWPRRVHVGRGTTREDLPWRRGQVHDSDGCTGETVIIIPAERVPGAEKYLQNFRVFKSRLENDFQCFSLKKLQGKQA